MKTGHGQRCTSVSTSLGFVRSRSRSLSFLCCSTCLLLPTWRFHPLLFQHGKDTGWTIAHANEIKLMLKDNATSALEHALTQTYVLAFLACSMRSQTSPPSKRQLSNMSPAYKSQRGNQESAVQSDVTDHICHRTYPQLKVRGELACQNDDDQCPGCGKAK